MEGKMEYGVGITLEYKWISEYVNIICKTSM